MGISAHGRNRSIVIVSFSLAAILLGTGHRAAADLTPTDVVMETVIGNMEDNVLGLVAAFGPVNDSLVFTTNMDAVAQTYSFSLAAGSTYGGVPITMMTAGSFDSVGDDWTSTTTGSLGMNSLAGTATFAYGDPPGRKPEASASNNGFEVGVDTRTFSNDPLDPTKLESTEFWTFTSVLGLHRVAYGADSVDKTIDELIDGFLLIMTPDQNGNGGGGPVVGNGVVDANTGIGNFVVTVPEPGTAALLGVGLVGLLEIARRRARRAG